MARLVLSVIFFVVLGILSANDSTLDRRLWLNVSLVLFVTAVVTDFLDGFLARRWKLVSTFGRIADPFADKIVICGGFVMLIGVAPHLIDPWFAVVIMFREFLVSGLRSFLESRGVPFGAAMSGKLKMVFQSATIPLVLFHVANIESGNDSAPTRTAEISELVCVGFLWLTLVFTVLSSVGYVQRAWTLLRGKDSAS